MRDVDWLNAFFKLAEIKQKSEEIEALKKRKLGDEGVLDFMAQQQSLLEEKKHTKLILEINRDLRILTIVLVCIGVVGVVIGSLQLYFMIA